MNSTEQPRKTVTVAEAAAMLSIADNDVQWLIDTGQLRPVRLKGKLLLCVDDLDRLVRVYQQVRSRSDPYGK